MEKKQISVEQANDMLLNYIKNENFTDELYSLAHCIVAKAIRDLERAYEVVDADGEPYDGSDDVEWYDGERDYLELFLMNKLRNVEE